MARDKYEPLKLNQTNRYAGYQFHARVKVDGMEPGTAFRYLILSVYHWIRSRVPESDRGVAELALPEPEDLGSLADEAFVPYHFSVGYTMDITPLVPDGIWALRLKEPDIGTDERPSVSGRFFTTRVGLRLNEKGYTELGIRIDVTDPASEEKEVDFAFRPGFVRSLAIQPSVCFEQVRELEYGRPLVVSSAEDYKQLVYLLESEDNQLPLVVFTHYRPGVKEPVSVSMEDFVKNGLPTVSGVQRPITGMGFPMKVERTIRVELPSVSSGKPLPLTYEKQKKVPDVTVSVTAPPVPVGSPVMLYDADAFARSVFGYAQVVVLGDAFFEKLVSRVKKEFRPGDIVLCGPRKFRGGVSVVGAFSGDEEAELKKAYASALLSAQSYSKHKSAYSYGSVVFEAEARQMEQQKKLQAIIEGHYEDKEKYDRLVEMVRELNQAIADKNERIKELGEQKDQEFDRGVAFRDYENARLDEEIAELRSDLAAEQEKNRQMLGEHQWAKNVLSAMDQMRKVAKLPEDNADVVSYFRQVYPDRLGFTERGEWEASRCGLKTDHLWEILYMIANDLTDLFREKEGNLTEEDVTRVAGCEMSFREGAMTRKDSDVMKLRDDDFEGKAISVEPHLKLKSVKGEPAHQRLHFCYDPELKKIIIGYLGDHLDSAATRYAGQR